MLRNRSGGHSKRPGGRSAFDGRRVRAGDCSGEALATGSQGPVQLDPRDWTLEGKMRLRRQKKASPTGSRHVPAEGVKHIDELMKARLEKSDRAFAEDIEKRRAGGSA